MRLTTFALLLLPIISDYLVPSFGFHVLTTKRMSPTSPITSTVPPPTSSTYSSPTSVMTMMNVNNDDINSQSKAASLLSPRSCILQIGCSAGKLCGIANTHLADYDSNAKPKNNTVLVLAIKNVLKDLWITSQALNLNISFAIRSKMALNKKKYPVELCKGKAGKYTQYSDQTGITQDNQSTMDHNHGDPNDSNNTAITLQDFVQEIPNLTQEILEFATARQWAQYHTPRNLVLAFMGELGELSELLQWDGDDSANTLEPKRLDKLSQELADVTIYILRLATVCDVIEELCETVKNDVE